MAFNLYKRNDASFIDDETIKIINEWCVENIGTKKALIEKIAQSSRWSKWSILSVLQGKIKAPTELIHVINRKTGLYFQKIEGKWRIDKDNKINYTDNGYLSLDRTKRMVYIYKFDNEQETTEEYFYMSNEDFTNRLRLMADKKSIDYGYPIGFEIISIKEKAPN